MGENAYIYTDSVEMRKNIFVSYWMLTVSQKMENNLNE